MEGRKIDYQQLLGVLSAAELAAIGITEDNRFHVEHKVLDWDRYFYEIACLVAQRSHDADTQHGCLLVRGRNIVSAGYNGFPSGAPDHLLPNTRLNDPSAMKLCFINHAEISAIFDAAKRGVSIQGCTAYITGPSCSDCCRALVSCGIVNWVIGPKSHKRTEQSFILSQFWKNVYNVNVKEILV